MEAKVWRHFDLLLLAAMLVLLGFGVAMIYSATLGIEGPDVMDGRVLRQGAYIAFGLLLFFAMSALDYRVLRNLAFAAYGLILLLLLVVLVTGQVLHGSQRWIDLGFFQLQPSEPAKLVLACVLARYFEEHIDQVRSLAIVLRSLLIPAPLVLLVLAQPDFGTASTYIVIWAGVVFVAGLRLLYLAAFIGVGIASAPVAWLIMHDYMRERIEVFLDPTRDPYDSGYNAIQALIGVGSGGLTGRGFLSGTQSQLRFLRVQYADFIFSVLAEELGLIGAVVLLVLFLILLWRGLRVMMISPDLFGRLVATGVVSAIVYQVFVSVGMNAGMLPIAGITLPLISYGGSSIVSVLAALGVLESVAMRHRKFEF